MIYDRPTVLWLAAHDRLLVTSKKQKVTSDNTVVTRYYVAIYGN